MSDYIDKNGKPLEWEPIELKKIKPHEERIYSVSFDLRSKFHWESDDDTEWRNEHLKSIKGIVDEIFSWWGDMKPRFDVMDLIVDLKQSTDPLIDPKTIKQNEKKLKEFE